MAGTPEYQRDESEGGAGLAVFMWVDSDGNQAPGRRALRVAGPCLHNEEDGDMLEQGYRRVFISPPPPEGWSSVTGAYIGLRGGYCGKVGFEGCSYDFETQTYLDQDGNRWDTTEFNKLAD